MFFSDLSFLFNEIENIPEVNAKLLLLEETIITKKITAQEVEIIKLFLNLKNSGVYTGFSAARIKDVDSLFYLNKEDNVNLEENIKEYNLFEIYDKILYFSKIEGSSSISTKIAFLKNLSRDLSGLSFQFLCRIITSNLRIGLSTRLFERIISSKSKIDTVKTVTALSFNLARKVDLSIGAGVFKKEVPHFIEPKYDGIRVRVCLNSSQREVYTRRGENITKKLLNFSTFKYKGPSVILDGQLNMKEFINFSKTLRSHVINIDNYSFEIFDILEKEKISLIESCLSDRKAILSELFSSSFSNSQLPFKEVPFEVVSSYSGEILPFLTAKLDALPLAIEGLMIKPSIGTYRGGTRSWFKFKREPETVDLIVLKRKKGSGKFKEIYCSFELGIAVKNEDRIQHAFLCSVGSGFKENDLEFLNNSLKWNFERPQENIIFQISYQEKITSSKNKIGFSLRFPIFKKYRIDLAEPTSVSLLGDKWN